ncbi:MAG TPA: SGNH/GDSL hydrolase family protein [Bryobacteraceae bacterium]|nr:SGNH/GDSL hydrolase family protein [Bryobacteraceae bacterium]
MKALRFGYEMKRTTTFLLTIVIGLPCLAAQHTHWVGTWEASPAPQLANEAQMRHDKLVFENQTIREIVHASIGGNTVRVRLSNAYGKDTIEIGAAHLALHAQGANIVAGSDHVLTFSGHPGIAIPPNAPVLSDPVQLNVPASGDLAISIFLPKATEGSGVHYAAQQTSYVAQGDVTSAASLSEPATITSWVFLTGVDVLAPEPASAVVAFGDSITDGARSTMDANHRWPNILADRLIAQHGKKEVAVLDAGIGGNRILHDAATNVRFGVNALARFNRDVIAQSGVKYVIVLEGINDLGHAGTSAPASETVSAEQIIAGLQQMIARAHEKGLKIFGATLTPFEGTTFPGYFTPEKEAKRKAINEWIRTSGAFDGVIDFDKAVRDPNDPDRMLPAYDGGDHLHPGDAGYKAMADAVPLGLFK